MLLVTRISVTRLSSSPSRSYTHAMRSSVWKQRWLLIPDTNSVPLISLVDSPRACHRLLCFLLRTTTTPILFRRTAMFKVRLLPCTMPTLRTWRIQVTASLMVLPQISPWVIKASFSSEVPSPVLVTQWQLVISSSLGMSASTVGPAPLVRPCCLSMSLLRKFNGKVTKRMRIPKRPQRCPMLIFNSRSCLWWETESSELLPALYLNYLKRGFD